MDKERKKYYKYGEIICSIVKVFMKTIRIKKICDDKYNKEENYIYAFWHQKIFFPTISLTEVEKKLAMTSPSRDGEIMSAVLAGYGYEILRGSSNDGNVRSLITMIKKLKQGYSLGFAVDGPKGPIFEIKPGIVYMAMKTGKEIVPVGGAFKKKYVFKKAWDKFHFPYPFTKGVVVIGEPIKIEKDANQEECIEYINKKINEVNKRAEELLNE